MAQAQIDRPDIDILHDLYQIQAQYPPVMHDRHNFDYEVKDGVVHVVGHVKARVTYNHLLNNMIPNVRGVKQVVSDRFFDDETIRLDAGRATPMGVQVNVEYGTVILTGELPEDVTIEQVVDQVSKIPGVTKVITAF